MTVRLRQARVAVSAWYDRRVSGYHRARYRLSWMARAGWLLFLRDFRYRFRLTYLGWFWLVARLPLMSLPLILVGSQFNMSGGKMTVPYPLYILTSVMLWQVFWDGVVMPQWLARRVRRVFPDIAFPPEALLAGAAGYAMVNAAMQLIAVAIAFIGFGHVPPPTIVIGLLALPVLLACGLAVGMPLTPFSFVYLDIRYALPFLSPVLMWTAPIVYAMPESGALRTLNAFNPVTYLVGIPRGWLLGGESLPVWAFAAGALVFAAVFLFGLPAYRRGMTLAVEFLSR